MESAFGIALYGDRGSLVAYDTHWEVYGDEGQEHTGDLECVDRSGTFIRMRESQRG